MEEQLQTMSKFDRIVGGLLGGNSLRARTTTVEQVEPITGEAESYMIQTVRTEKAMIREKDGKTITKIGEHVIVKYLDKHGPVRLVLPPKVVETIIRQRDSLSAQARSNSAKMKAQERKDRGELPGFMKRKV
jgi:hypothetical protein